MSLAQNSQTLLLEMKGKNPADMTAPQIQIVENVIEELDQGGLRVAEFSAGKWVTHSWIKEVILLYFRIRQVEPIQIGSISFLDKIPTKNWKLTDKVRVVPPAIARYGSFVDSGAILMPSFVNIGARVGKNTMIDTWATVGSCAQVGSDVHISGGVGIGGVLEPVQAQPVIIEDNVFVGSRCILVEGVHVGQGAVLGAGVTITGSTKVIDVTEDEERIHKGLVPPLSVVIPGTYSKHFPAGSFGVPCALIIGKRSAKTDLKTSLTDALRDHQVTV